MLEVDIDAFAIPRMRGCLIENVANDCAPTLRSLRRLLKKVAPPLHAFHDLLYIQSELCSYCYARAPGASSAEKVIKAKAEKRDYFARSTASLFIPR